MYVSFFKFSCVNWNVENQDFTASQDTADKIVHDISDNSIQLIKHEKWKLWDFLGTGSDKDTVCESYKQLYLLFHYYGG